MTQSTFDAHVDFLLQSRAPARINDNSVRRQTDRIVLTTDDMGCETPRPFSRDRARRAAVARIAAVLDERMREEGITSVRGIADRVGMSWKPIDKLLNGDPDPQLATLLQLAHALDLRSLEELLGPFETTRVLQAGRAIEPEE